jgi:hypothetical protein
MSSIIEDFGLLYYTVICKPILCVPSLNISVNLIPEPFNTTLPTLAKASCSNKLSLDLLINLLILDFIPV